jgi:hypothetical protein
MNGNVARIDFSLEVFEVIDIADTKDPAATKSDEKKSKLLRSGCGEGISVFVPN